MAKSQTEHAILQLPCWWLNACSPPSLHGLHSQPPLVIGSYSLGLLWPTWCLPVDQVVKITMKNCLNVQEVQRTERRRAEFYDTNTDSVWKECVFCICYHGDDWEWHSDKCESEKRVTKSDLVGLQILFKFFPIPTFGLKFDLTLGYQLDAKLKSRRVLCPTYFFHSGLLFISSCCCLIFYNTVC